VIRIQDFSAEADIVGRRVQVHWTFELAGGEPLSAIPRVIVRRKLLDFEFPGAAPDPFLVYDSAAFPPQGAIVDEVPGWERREGSLRTLVTVESVKRTVEGRLSEVLRRTTATTFDLAGRPQRREVTVLDTGDSLGGLEPGTSYYYQLFSPAIAAGSDPRPYRASATPGQIHGSGRRLYNLLPAVHRRHDVATRPATPGTDGIPEAAAQSGQLRRLLDLFGAPFDLIRTSADGLLGVHDVDRVDARFLPLLAHLAGWELNLNSPIPVQRHEIKHAPALYRLVGTVAGARIWVQRLTGWEGRVKEFIGNVFRTNAPEATRLWEIWEQRHDGAAWSPATPVTRTTSFDGRPAVALDGAGTLWLFFHSFRTSRQELWVQRLGVDLDPRRVMDGTPDDSPEHTFSDRDPAVVSDGASLWLFFSSDRSGGFDIWSRRFAGLPGEDAVRLTEDGLDNRLPAAVRDSGGDLWLFWQAERRGRAEIWARVFDGAQWTDAERLSEAELADEAPAAALDAGGRLWLFWSADLGDRSNLRARVLDGGVWGPTETITVGQHRDYAPRAVLFGGRLWLLWHSNQSGNWRLRASVHDGVAFGDPSDATEDVEPDKEPTAIVDAAGELRLLWRSQRGGRRLHSRTIDTSDAEMLGALGTFGDGAHYTFDTRKINDAWYAPDTVGLFLTPDTVDEAEIRRGVDRVQRFMEPFRPLPVRFVWVLEKAP